jgi:hypothetical protein
VICTLLSRRVEGLDKYCRKLRILYLQDNAIQRLENLNRLKYLGTAYMRSCSLRKNTILLLILEKCFVLYAYLR